MQAVTITQITPPELEALIENSIKKVLSTQQAEQPAETDRRAGFGSRYQRTVARRVPD